MPNRIIRDGILESHAVNRLSPEAELFYRRIMSLVDDFGRYEWDAQKLRLRAMGLRYDWADEAKIAQWMAELAKDLVVVYKVADKTYFEIKNFNQRTRSDKSKYPSYEESTTYKENDRHMSADGGQVTDIGGQVLADDSHPRTYSYSETYSKTDTKSSVVPFPEKTKPKPETPDPVKAFIAAYPKKTGTQMGIQTYLSIVDAVDHGEVLAGLERWKISEAWLKDEGKWIPEPAKWLTERRWKDFPEPRAQPGGLFGSIPIVLRDLR